MKLLSPAKLNLFLHIVGRRADGYHLLQSLFQLIDLCDEMEFSANRSGLITLECDQAIALEDNLIYKAAKLLQSHTNTCQGADIKIQKHIPIGGGLGGGSSNAATTLLALNQLWQLNLSTDALAKLGLSLGADVPFFINGKNAWVEGIGEHIYPINTEALTFLVVIPNDLHISTPEVFSHPELNRNTATQNMKTFDWRQGHNDCQPVVEKLFPQVKDIIQLLTPHALTRMSGTGCSVFAAFDSPQSAKTIQALVPNGYSSHLRQSLVRSPVVDLI